MKRTLAFFATVIFSVAAQAQSWPTKPVKLLARYAADVIVYGHTHIPLITKADGRLVVNPCAAGAARFEIVPSVAILEISNGVPSARIIALS